MIARSNRVKVTGLGLGPESGPESGLGLGQGLGLGLGVDE